MATLSYLGTTKGALVVIDGGRRRLAVRLDTSTLVTEDGTVTSTLLVCSLYPGNEKENLFVWGSDTGFTLAEPTPEDGPLPAGTTYQLRLNGGAWVSSTAAFNQQLRELGAEARKAGFRHEILLTLPPQTSVATKATLVFAATYYES